MSVRAAVKQWAPQRVVEARRRRQMARILERNRDRSHAEIFSAVYAESSWGSSDDFDSGEGSRRPDLVEPYVAAVTAFLASLPALPDVVDLGCGDFNVGAQIRPSCARYVATDVVPELLERNRGLPGSVDVEFVVGDLVNDPLPLGDVAMLRQVLQHLSNDAVTSVVTKLQQYKYVIITDHQPSAPFLPNVDIPSGSAIRDALGSGLDLAEPPFDFRHVERRDLCCVPFHESVVRTTVFRIS